MFCATGWKPCQYTRERYERDLSALSGTDNYLGQLVGWDVGHFCTVVFGDDELTMLSDTNVTYSIA